MSLCTAYTLFYLEIHEQRMLRKFTSKVKILCLAVAAAGLLICVVGTVYCFAGRPLAEDMLLMWAMSLSAGL